MPGGLGVAVLGGGQAVLVAGVCDASNPGRLGPPGPRRGPERTQGGGGGQSASACSSSASSTCWPLASCSSSWTMGRRQSSAMAAAIRAAAARASGSAGPGVVVRGLVMGGNQQRGNGNSEGPGGSTSKLASITSAPKPTARWVLAGASAGTLPSVPAPPAVSAGTVLARQHRSTFQ